MTTLPDRPIVLTVNDKSRELRPSRPDNPRLPLWKVGISFMLKALKVIFLNLN